MRTAGITWSWLLMQVTSSDSMLMVLMWSMLAFRVVVLFATRRAGISIASYNAGEYNQPFDGNIGEVMIFADALNSTTISQMYNASKGSYSNTTNLSYSASSYTFH